MKYRVTYTNEEVIGISENDSSFTYTAENVIVGTLYETGVYQRTIGVDTTKLEEFEAEIAAGNKPIDWSSPMFGYSFFIIPLDIVSQIKHYSAWVKEAYPEKIFDVVLNTEEIEVEGQVVTVPTNIIKMIPCGITAFNPEGEMLLDAVIESWNTQVPSKAIDFNVKFYSLSELTQFIESCTNSR